MSTKIALLVAAAVVIAAGPALAQDNLTGVWPMVNHDLSQTADNPGVPYTFGAWDEGGARVSWALDLSTVGGGVQMGTSPMSPVVDENDNIYWMEQQAPFRVISVDSAGAFRWAQAIPGAPGVTQIGRDLSQSGVVSGAHEIYRVSLCMAAPAENQGDGWATATYKNDPDGGGPLNAGDNKWVTALIPTDTARPHGSSTAPLLYNGKLYIVGAVPGDNDTVGQYVTMYALNAATGAILTQTDVPNYPVNENTISTPTFVPDLFGEGKHGIIWQLNMQASGPPPSVGRLWCVEADESAGNPVFTLAWSAQANFSWNTFRPKYIAATKRIHITFYGDWGYSNAMYDALTGAQLWTDNHGNYGYTDGGGVARDNPHVIYSRCPGGGATPTFYKIVDNDTSATATTWATKPDSAGETWGGGCIIGSGPDWPKGVAVAEQRGPAGGMGVFATDLDNWCQGLRTMWAYMLPGALGSGGRGGIAPLSDGRLVMFSTVGSNGTLVCIEPDPSGTQRDCSEFGAISGTVTVVGKPVQNAVVGIKTTPSATADAYAYYFTDAAGQYQTDEVTRGTWYVGAWVDTFQEVETSVLVDGNKVVNLDITKTQGKNIALNQPHYGGNGEDCFVNGQRYGGAFWWVVGGPPPAPQPMAMGVDLGADKTVGQALIDWFVWIHPYGYKVQYAVDNAGTDPPGLLDPAWMDFYTSPTTNAFYFPFLGDSGPYAAISAPAKTGRWWRIYAEDGPDWNGGISMGVREFEVYSADEFGGCVQGIVKEAGGVAGPGDPIYNAVVQIGGIAGPVDISKADPKGSYSIACSTGAQELYADAAGYKPHAEQINVPLDGTILVKDIFLTADAGDTNQAYNGDFELGMDGWGTHAGHPDYPEDAIPPWPGYIDVNATRFPAAPDMYVGATRAGYNSATAGEIDAGTPLSVHEWRNDFNWFWDGTTTGLTKVDETTSLITDTVHSGQGNWYTNWVVEYNVTVKLTEGTLVKTYKSVSNDADNITVLGDPIADGFSAGGGQAYECWSDGGPRYWYWGWMSPSADKKITVDHNAVYNVYFKGMAGGEGGSVRSLLVYRDAAGNRVSGGAQFDGVGGGWTQVDHSNLGYTVRVAPPSNAVTLDLMLGFEDWPGNPTKTAYLAIDDLVVDKVPLPSISGTVTVGGSTVANAVVGVKTVANPLADPDVYALTAGDGTYSIPANPGTYYVSAWAEGYREVNYPTTVTVTFGSGAEANFSLPDKSFNFAYHKRCYTVPLGRHDDWVPTMPNWTYWEDFTTDNNYFGDWNYAKTLDGSVGPKAMQIDLGVAREIDQALIMWQDYARPRDEYKIQYADGYTGSTMPALDDTSWTDWYTGDMANATRNGFYIPDTNSHMEAATGPAVEARWWRVFSACGGENWGGYFGVFEIKFISSEAPGKIAGTVTGNSPVANAAIGVKSATSATADADYYYRTDGDGNFETTDLGVGTWYVGVWADGFRMMETPVSVTANATAPCDFDLTEPQYENVARGNPVFSSDNYWFDGSGPYNVADGGPGGDQPPGALVDGDRDNNYSWAGNTSLSNSTYDGWMGVDLRFDKEVSQMLIRFHPAPVVPNGYKVQYATSSEPGIWHDWYVHFPAYGVPRERTIDYGSGYEAITGPATTARFWRIWANDGYQNVWNWSPAFAVIEFEVYSSTPSPGIGDIKKWDDGKDVTLNAKSVTLAPTLAGNMAFFYIEEPTRASGIRVVPFAPALLNVNDMVAVSGIMATMPPGPPFGERYIANAMFPEPTVTSVIKPLGVSNRAVQEDALIVGELVTTTGEVKATTGGGDFTISDGYYKAAAPFNTTVVVAGDPIAPVSVGEVVAVTGVVSLQVGVGGPERVIIYRSVSPLRPPTPPFSWSTGFEPGEGYVLGPLVPQNGWTLEASGGPTPGSATVVAAPGDPVMGTQALKLDCPSRGGNPVASDTVRVEHPSGTGGANLGYMVVSFYVYRVDGSQWLPYPENPGEWPFTRCNNLWWTSNDPVPDGGGQWDIGPGTWPWAWNGSGPIIAGRYAQVVFYLNFVNHLECSWYDGQLLDSYVPFDQALVGWMDIVFMYEQTQPFLEGSYGKPAYIDKVSMGWDL